MNKFSITCRLCINISNTYNNLYDVNGHRTEVYLRTARYFSAKLLDLDGGRHLCVICADCWRHISDFHAFQESVLLAQHGLINKQTDLVIQPEIIPNPANAIEKPDNQHFVTDITGGLNWTSTAKQPHNNVTTSMIYANDNPPTSSIIHQSHNDVTTCKQDTTSKIYANNNATTSSIIHQPHNDVTTCEQPDNKLFVTNITGGLNWTPTAEQPHNDVITCEQDTTSKIYANDKATTSSLIDQQENICGIIIKEEEQMLTSSNDHSSLFLKKEEEDEDDIKDSEEFLNVSEESGASGSETYETNSNSDEELSAIKSKRPKLQSVEDYDRFITKWRATLDCEVCGATTANFSLLLQHFEEQHPQQSCHIMCCDHKFRNRHEIVQHIIYHQEEHKGFKCEKCFKIYGRKDTLTEHIEVVHFDKGDRIKCPKCPSILRRVYLKSHLRRYCNKGIEDKKVEDRPHVCPICGKSFATKMYLETHDKRIHSSHGGPNVCAICNMAFVFKAHLNRHMSKHNGKRVSCPYCPKTYRYSYCLTDHLKKLHPKEWEEKQQNATMDSCPFCPRKFKYTHQLKYHLKCMHSEKMEQTNIKNK